MSLLRSGALVVALLAMPAIARADALDDGVRRVALQLQCPVCEGQTVADSPSGLAADMRAVIRSKLSAGETNQQILDEFVASYGDGILTEPPKRGIGLGVWLGPVVGVLLGAVLLGMLLRAWRRPRMATTEVAFEDPEVAAELYQFREHVGQ